MKKSSTKSNNLASDELAKKMAKSIPDDKLQSLRDYIEKMKPVLPQVASFSRDLSAYIDKLSELDKQSELIIKEMKTDGIKEFIKKPPIDRHVFLTIVGKLNKEEREKASKLLEEAGQRARSDTAKKAAKAKSEKYEPLKQKAKELVEAKENWPSRRNAAIKIAPEIINLSYQIGVNLSQDQAITTISSWLKEMDLPAKK